MSTFSTTSIKTVLTTFRRRIHSTTVTLNMHALRLESGPFPAYGLAYTHQYSLDGRESPDPVGLDQDTWSLSLNLYNTFLVHAPLYSFYSWTFVR